MTLKYWYLRVSKARTVPSKLAVTTVLFFFGENFTAVILASCSLVVEKQK